ncbi:hypothetical protein MAM1_0201d07880 [Mucor ambiguus]|uniref:Uncharacterized protein n=1 Tax=Mucor ambiguus TaxID=91626 RepID=A0A0C9MCM4_9FUNG|nr:hypothetical protein MAM1_0201d07880 [Mucor ambiguus]
MSYYTYYLYKYLVSSRQRRITDSNTKLRTKCRRLLQSEKVKDIVIKSILGSNVSKSRYPSFKENNFNEALFSITYAPDSNYSILEHLPPIAIVIQDSIDETAMADLVYYSTRLYEQYKTLPILVAIPMKGFACDKMLAEFGSDISINKNLFKVNEAKSCLLWALHLHVFTLESVKAYIHKSPMDRMIALICCIVQADKLSESQCQDPTMKTLLKLFK